MTRISSPNPYEGQEKWKWCMEWCKEQGISPAPSENWERAAAAYYEKEKEGDRESLLNQLPYLCSMYVEIMVIHLATDHSIVSGYIVAVEPQGDHVQISLEINKEYRCTDIGHDLSFNELEEKLLGFVDDFIEYLYDLDQTKT